MWRWLRPNELEARINRRALDEHLKAIGRIGPETAPPIPNLLKAEVKRQRSTPVALVDTA